jgi:hypothetical protein
VCQFIVYELSNAKDVSATDRYHIEAHIDNVYRRRL